MFRNVSLGSYRACSEAKSAISAVYLVREGYDGRLASCGPCDVVIATVLETWQPSPVSASSLCSVLGICTAYTHIGSEDSVHPKIRSEQCFLASGPKARWCFINALTSRDFSQPRARQKSEQIQTHYPETWLLWRPALPISSYVIYDTSNVYIYILYIYFIYIEINDIYIYHNTIFKPRLYQLSKALTVQLSNQLSQDIGILLACLDMMQCPRLWNKYHRHSVSFEPCMSRKPNECSGDEKKLRLKSNKRNASKPEQNLSNLHLFIWTCLQITRIGLQESKGKLPQLLQASAQSLGLDCLPKRNPWERSWCLLLTIQVSISKTALVNSEFPSADFDVISVIQNNAFLQMEEQQNPWLRHQASLGTRWRADKSASQSTIGPSSKCTALNARMFWIYPSEHGARISCHNCRLFSIQVQHIKQKWQMKELKHEP